MDGKLLILCDEKPGTHKMPDGKEYVIRDSMFLRRPILLPEDDTDKVFVSWNSIIPEDRWFIEACKHYAKFTEKPQADFILRKRGSTDPATGTIKESLQENSYYGTYERNLKYLSNISKELLNAEAMELSVQYPFDATQRFLDDFTEMVEQNGFVGILPTFSKNSESRISRYRLEMFEAWKNNNELAKKMNKRDYKKYSTATIFDTAQYDDFAEILYGKSTDALMQIYSMPDFYDDTNSSHGKKEEPDDDSRI